MQTVQANRRRRAKRKTQARGAQKAREARKTRGAQPGGKRKSTRRERWSARVTRESDALDLDRGVFTLESPRRIAASLKRSAERSRRRKSSPYRSALSMLVFYINRAGKNLPARRLKVLRRAKDELRLLFQRA